MSMQIHLNKAIKKETGNIFKDQSKNIQNKIKIKKIG